MEIPFFHIDSPITRTLSTTICLHYRTIWDSDYLNVHPHKSRQAHLIIITMNNIVLQFIQAQNTTCFFFVFFFFNLSEVEVKCYSLSRVLTLCNPMDYSPPGSSVRGISPARNTGAGCHFPLQGLFPTQGSNLGLQHCRQILLSEPPGKPFLRLISCYSECDANI